MIRDTPCSRYRNRSRGTCVKPDLGHQRLGHASHDMFMKFTLLLQRISNSLQHLNMDIVIHESVQSPSELLVSRKNQLE